MSQDHAARPHPPSSRRSAEARAQGHLPRAPLAGLMFVVLSLLASAWALGPSALELVRALFREPLELAATGHGAQARARALALLGELASTCAPAVLVVVLSVALGLIVVQGPAFARGPAAHGASFPALSISRTASLLWCAGALLIAALVLGSWATLEPGTLGASLRAWAGQLVVLCLGALLVDAAFARARFHASLWLTRREHLDEQRAALGPPEARAARSEQRRSWLRAFSEPRSHAGSSRPRTSPRAGS